MSVMSQDEYLAILFIDTGYDTATQRRGWLQKRFGVGYADELTKDQKSAAINFLKGEKEPAPGGRFGDGDYL